MPTLIGGGLPGVLGFSLPYVMFSCMSWASDMTLECKAG